MRIFISVSQPLFTASMTFQIVNVFQLRGAPVLGRPVCRGDGETTIFPARVFYLVFSRLHIFILFYELGSE
jgi:hypothetical protein